MGGGDFVAFEQDIQVVLLGWSCLQAKNVEALKVWKKAVDVICCSFDYV